MRRASSDASWQHVPCLILFCLSPSLVCAAGSDADQRHFESKVRPLLVEQCVKCHGPDKQRGGLRLDSAAALRKGGDTGPVVVPGEPDKSLLLQAVRQTGDLKMPPETKLTAQQIADLAAWVRSGAVWPEAETVTASSRPPASPISPSAPNERLLQSHLQAWYRADALPLADGNPVPVWPDGSGRGHDLTVTSGVRRGGVGKAAAFAAESTLNRRPAVRFGPESGLAGSPDHPVAIRGDAALTVMLVLNLQPNDTQPPFDGILGIGDPAHPERDPGRPHATLVQIRRTGPHQLEFAGGWNHDAHLGPDSARLLYGQPVLLTIVKTPGPMRASTRFYINGLASEQTALQRNSEGRETIPDVRPRSDIGLYMGRVLGWGSGFRGDVGEVLVYSKALSDIERQAVEAHLAEKYALPLSSLLSSSARRFTAEQQGFWAFQPVKAPPLPAVKDRAWPTSAIDRFILARLEERGLRPSPQAGKRTLIRRLTFDLTGLPPTPAEIDSFLQDDSPNALARVVDRLLASPHYGERWGRHWLDVVRYAETTANDANAVMRYAWRYRDYVVDAFNRDLPYDRFVVEQLAGDLLPLSADPREMARQVIATGFLMVGPKALAETDKEQSRMDIVDDQIDVTGRVFLGLTLGCARCHDHKFDPITTADYYALAGIFRSTEHFQDENRNATMWQEWSLAPPGEKPLMVMAPKEARPVNLRVHVRGNRFKLGPLVPRRYPEILSGPKAEVLRTSQSGRRELAGWIARKENPLTCRVMVNRIWQHHFGTGLVATSDNFGRRGERPSHPELLDWLAARFVDSGWSIKEMHRLIVLSRTYQMASTVSPDGERLDPNNRLLGRFPRRRLEAEALRDAMLAVSGRLDRQVGGGESAEALWKKAEILDAKRGFAPNRLQTHDPCYNTPRRSIYLPVVRNAVPDVFALFDAADPNGVTAVRNDTTVPAQALFLLNNPFVREQALHFAQSLLHDATARDGDRVRSAYARAFGRPPSQEEAKEAEFFLQRYTEIARGLGRNVAEARLSAWQSYCQMLFCTNEFLYVD